MLRKIMRVVVLARPVILSILSGALLALSFPRAEIWLFGWIGVIPLLYALEGRRWKERFALGCCCGAVYFGGTIYWLVNVTFFGTLLLVFYLSLYVGLFSSFSTPRNKIIPGFLYLPSLWVALEYARANLLSGFGWALLGYSQYRNLGLIQIAGIGGAWTVSFLLVMVNVLFFNILRELRVSSVSGERRFFSKKAAGYLIIAVVSVSLVLCYGARSISQPQDGPIVRVGVIQPSIEQRFKWQDGLKEWIFSKHYFLSVEEAGQKPDIIIWPEAAVTDYLDTDKPLREQPFYRRTLDFSTEYGIPLLIGAVVETPQRYFNSALFIENGRLKGRYDKIHLVPFGEYIPFRRSLPFLEAVVPIGDISAGEEFTVFSLSLKEGIKVNFAVLVCFEDTIASLARGFAHEGAQFLVNITNDAWFGESASPYQHMQSSVFRAVETGRAVVRAANTGVSAFIDHHGRISGTVVSRGKEIFVEGTLTQGIIASSKRTVYSRIGEIFVVVCFCLLLAGLFPEALIRRSLSGSRRAGQ